MTRYDNELLSATDRFFNDAIVEGVVRDAKWALDAKRYRAAVILTYSGIDTMASLVRHPKSQKVERSDFVAWVEHFMDFKCDAGPSGLEVYAARCGLLHANMSESGHSKAGKARMIGYVDVANEPVLKSEEVNDLLLLSVRHLVGIFAEGVLKTWKEIKQSSDLLVLVHERLQKLIISYDVKQR